MDDDYDGEEELFGEPEEAVENRLYYFDLAQRMTGSNQLEEIFAAAEKIEAWFGDAHDEVKAAAIEQMLQMRGASEPFDLFAAADMFVGWLRRD